MTQAGASCLLSLRPQTVDFDQTWNQISDTASKVIVLAPVPKPEWNDRFHDVYKLCVAFPEPLSDRVYAETKKLLETHVQKLYQEISKTVGPELLHEYYTKWTTFKQGIGYLSTLYIYLNSQYIRKYRFSAADVEFGDNQDNQLMEISELGAYLWKVHMITPLKDKMVRLLIAAIDEDRRGKEQNSQAIYNVISSFIFVEHFRPKHKNKFYQEIFEKPFIAATIQFYKKEAIALLERNNCSKYMEQVLLRLDIERKRLKEYLPLKESHKRVIEGCERCMVGEYLLFLQSECRLMVKEENSKDLRNMFKLLKPLDSGLQALLDQIKAHIKEKGLETVRALNMKDDSFVQSFVEDLLKVHQHFMKLITDVFEKDKQFVQALDEAFTDVVNFRENNKSPCRSPEVLARFFDSMLKKSSKCHNETEMEELMNKAIEIFKYITDKDVFQKFYSKMLAKRLIYTQYISLDAEETMINKLKVACGYEFTSKLHRMFTDIKVSEDLSAQFISKIAEENVNLQLSFSVYILQACAWPLNNASTFTCILPPICENTQQHFENFYQKKFNGRKLTWLYHLSNGEVKFLYTKKVYTVLMTTYHVSIIQMFEKLDKQTYDEIQKHTTLNDEQLQRHLHSFVDTRILLPLLGTGEPMDDKSTPASALTFAKDTIFKLNFNFANKRQKFKLVLPVQKEAAQAIQQKESEQTHASIEEDRKLFLQAAIVRIMKSRKKEKHNLLIDEVINQAKSRFTPSIQMIKKAIESLIEKQYVERLSSNDEYTYIA